MTGQELARRLEVSFVGSTYDPISGTVHLTPEVAGGSDAMSLFVAAHEATHRLQHYRWPILFCLRWFTPVNLWLEWHASREALRIIAPMIKPQEREACQAFAQKALWSYFTGKPISPV